MRKYKYNADEVMFTADTHFGHDNIIRLARRPYKSGYHMDESLIANWNEVVDEDQVVFHLGDFTYKGKQTIPNLLKRLNGEVILIQGNHDKDSHAKHYSAMHDIAEVEVDGQSIVMCHYAMRVWNRSFRGVWHIHGHSHGKLPADWDRKICDIGVDAWGYTPVSFHQLQKEMVRHGDKSVRDKE
jgi:calcineurin-like phosphoesterase family protein